MMRKYKCLVICWPCFSLQGVKKMILILFRILHNSPLQVCIGAEDARGHES
jgi:hypothetical protein